MRVAGVTGSGPRTRWSHSSGGVTRPGPPTCSRKLWRLVPAVFGMCRKYTNSGGTVMPREYHGRGSRSSQGPRLRQQFERPVLARLGDARQPAPAPHDSTPQVLPVQVEVGEVHLFTAREP